MKALRCIILLAVFLTPVLVKAQPAWNYVVNGKVTHNSEQANLEGAVVSLSKNGSQVNQMVTKKGGKYTFVLDPDGEYMISYTKAGYCTKRIFVSTKNVPEERSKFGFSNQPIDVDLFELPPDPGTVSKISELLAEPMGKFVYVPSAQDFDFDEKYANEVKKKLKELLKIQKDIEEMKKDSAFKYAQVTQFLNAGNSLYDQKKYQDALVQYNEGLKIQPNNASLLAKIEDTKKKIKEEEDKKALFDKYLAIKNEADVLFKQQKWEDAKSKYKESLVILPNEQYPKTQIELCDKELLKLKDAAKTEEEYQAAIKIANENFGQSKWQVALDNYNKALSLKPKEPYPAQQILICKQKLKEITDLESKYLVAIGKGDAALKTSDWKNARAGYTEALTYKKDDPYALDQLKKVEAGEKSANAELEYTKLIQKADGLFKSAQPDYLNAKTNYEQALTYKPEDVYAKKQIDLCNKEIEKIKGQKDLQAKYDAAVAEGNTAFKSAKWEDAIAAYNKALTFLPLENYPKDQIVLCKAELDKIKNQKDLQAKYDAAVNEGNAAFKLQKWENAIAAYNKALGFKPEEKYPKDQIVLANAELEKIKGQKDLQAKYDAAVNEGNAAFKLQKWENAIAAYNKALGFKPEEKYPKDQIALANAELEKVKGQKDLQAKYDAAVNEGNTAFKAQKWEDAITAYNKALGFKPEEKYPKDQISLANAELEKIKAQKDIQAKYDAAVNEGNTAFKAGKWEDAVTAYNKALGFKPAEKYPQDQIALCNKELNKLKSLKEIQAQYDAAINEGNTAFKAGKWENAIASYNKAVGLKPEEKYPKDQILLCNAELDKIKAQKDLQAKYDAAVNEGNAAFKLEKWENAIAAYNKALGFKPEEKYPKDQIALANAELEKVKGQKDLQAKYDAAVNEGNTAFKAQKWEDAITAYNKALGFKPGEKYPKDQISLANAELDKIKGLKNLQEKYDLAIKNGNSNFDSQEYLTAKKFYEEALTYRKEDYPKQRLAEIEKKLAALQKYKDAIAKADNLFKASDWKGAKAGYQTALTFKDDQYPKDQMALCDKNLLGIENDKLNAKKYDDAIKAADKFYGLKDWNNALSKYNEALTYKPNEPHPTNRVNEINGILAKIKEEEDKIRKEQEMNAKYKAAVDAGDILFSKKDYFNAKSKYEEALTYLPGQPYPASQIAKCNSFLNADPTLKAYNEYMTMGKKAFDEKKYKDAKNYYQAALDTKPEKKEPADKIAEIESILKTIQMNKEEEEKAKQYNVLIKEANDLFAKREWNKAKIKYQQASVLQPSDQYPKDKIVQCDAFLNPNNTVVKNNDPTYQSDPEYEKKRKERYNNLTAKYGGPGKYEVPEEKEGNKTITTYVIITEDDAYVYKKVFFSFGHATYWKNDIPINALEFESAINPQN